MIDADSDNKQDRSGRINQVWVGLGGILLLIVIPPLCRDARWLIPFLALLIVPPLIVLLLRGRIGRAKTAGSLYLMVSASWLVQGITPWINPVWLAQGIIGLAVAIALMYDRRIAYTAGAALAFLGLRVVATNGALPMISAVLSAGAMLFLAYGKRSAPVALGLVLVLMMPFPFGKPTTLKVVEGYKMRRMARAGEKADPKPLMYGLNDPDALIRAEAVRQLGAIAQMRKEEGNGRLDAIIDALVPMIDDAETREIAVSQLAAVGNELAVKSIVDSIGQYPDMDARIYRPIFGASGEYAAQMLMELLLNSAGSEWREIIVRRQALILLGNVRDRRVVEAIAKHLGDESRDVRQAAVNSLRRMNRSVAVELLMAGLRDDSYRVRRSAAGMLAEPRLSAGVKFARAEALVEAARDEDASVRKHAVQALGNLSDKRALNTLLNALADGDRSVRRQAVRALGNVGGESVVEPLMGMLEDRYVRRDAAEVLGRTGDPEGVNAAVEAMVSDLGHEDLRVSTSAAETLGKIGGENAVAPLIKALKDTRWRVREVAARSLGSMGADRAAQPLVEALGDAEPSVRRAAAEAIHGLGDPQAVGLAVKAMLNDLSDRDPRVRESSAEALGRLGSRSVVPQLMRVAKEDRFGNVRRAALSALAPLTNIRIEHWSMIGPFDNTNRIGFENQYPPEKEIDLSGVYDGKGEKVQWSKHTEGKTSNLMPFFKTNQNVVIYALTSIVSPDDREAVFRVGSDDGIKVWLNDSLVWANDVYSGLAIDSDVFTVRLKSGKNKVLIKLTQGTIDCGFHLRITDDDGVPFNDLEYLNPL